MKAIHGTAIYTGGGCYSVIGELDNGLWFNGCMDFCEIINADVRTTGENGDLTCFDNEWLEKHVVNDYTYSEKWQMLKDFCTRLDSEEEGLTEGYDELSNYIAGEVTGMLDIPNCQ